MSLWPRRGPSPDHADTLISDFQPPESWAINICCLQATQSVMLCYSSLNGLRHQEKVTLPQQHGGAGGAILMKPAELGGYWWKMLTTRDWGARRVRNTRGETGSWTILKIIAYEEDVKNLKMISPDTRRLERCNYHQVWGSPCPALGGQPAVLPALVSFLYFIHSLTSPTLQLLS